MTATPLHPVCAVIAMLVATAIALPAVADGGTAPPMPGAAMPVQGKATGDANIAGPAGEPAERADPPGNAGAAPEEPGSRLLRALAAVPDLGLVPAGPEAPGAAPVFAAEGCPRGVLRRLLAGAADEAGALSALAIEQELLVLCRERQEIVAGLLETEARLRELRAPGEGTGPAEVLAAVVEAVLETPAAAAPSPPSASPSPLRAALEAEADPEEQAPPEPGYGWFSIIGSAGALRAGVTDGTGVWFVREGDALPGGAAVAAISGRPPGVLLAGPGGDGGETPLPYRARPEDGP